VPSPATLDSILGELLLGPTSIERFAGYTSDLPKGFVLVGATLKNKLGVLDIATPLTTLSRENQILALGQLVLTAYDVGATAGIEITVAGSPRLSLLPNGSRHLIVTRADFASLLNP
jgi:spore germination protein GerM